MENPFITFRQKYLDLADRHQAGYGAATPFPHAVIDDLLPVELCRQLVQEFADPASEEWTRFNDPTGVKLAAHDALRFPQTTEHLLACFNSAAFIDFLERLTGIQGLVPDPWFEGGGMHQIIRGGYLKVHADFNRHERLQLDRRINVLLYLNEDWQEDYGGHLQLWNREMTECATKVLPIFNRCVVFSTTDWSWHGHPEPLNCPDGMSRKSLALYYYSNGRPDEEVSPAHSTLYRQTPDEARRATQLGSRLRHGCSRCLDAAASLAHKPSSLLRRMAAAIRPRD